MKIPFVLCLLLFSSCPIAKTAIDLFIYVDKPPFTVDKNAKLGLNYDFAAALNRHSKEFHYSIVHIPKPRILTVDNNPGVVLWTTPTWVDDTAMSKYDWILDLIPEQELYITHDKTMHYQEESSLHNKTIATVRSYTYFNLEKLFKNKLAIRVNVHNEKAVALMLMHKRADLGVIGLQTFEYFKRTIPDINDHLKILTGYNKVFQRSILISQSTPEIKQDIQGWLNSEEGKAEWQAIKDKWLLH
ncbi:transporter substrate-binding domain-containing protein [Colwellia sp. 1_MG-2023]|uniref:transporter substrate-binding domain-containing protein n=1 Tax=Colwellia sp. 1_MG-2023 TaxID=3062649 RepID=UPI0026E2D223|nr:transporter substrate-binding domain-containing protein [Colwellia sp. 1_MG-2023]MDO6446297.1 transporter substrate-binding domain-containing protein [Colwellia sp. 1_MG-2023]